MNYEQIRHSEPMKGALEAAINAARCRISRCVLCGDRRSRRRRIMGSPHRAGDADPTVLCDIGRAVRARSASRRGPGSRARHKLLPEVLFVCVHNAGRSQMAAAIAHHLADGRVGVRSAGSHPGEQIFPAVTEAMNEVGIDISHEFPKPLTDIVVQAADVVITMGCGDSCPVYPGKRYQDWEIADPAISRSRSSARSAKTSRPMSSSCSARLTGCDRPVEHS